MAGCSGQAAGPPTWPGCTRPWSASPAMTSGGSGVIAGWKHGPHQLTYWQTERTFGLAADAAGKDEPTGCRRASCRAYAMTCWKPASRTSSRTAAGRWPWTGPTWSPSPAPARPGRPLRRPRSLVGTPQEQPAAQPGGAVLRVLPVRRDHDAR